MDPGISEPQLLLLSPKAKLSPAATAAREGILRCDHTLSLTEVEVLEGALE
jgi:hypothetical protein